MLELQRWGARIAQLRRIGEVWMFVRRCWEPRSEEEIYSLIEANPWALLVNNGERGSFATNLPLLCDRSRGGKGVLVGQLARANAHDDSIQSLTTPALAIFQGP